MIKQNEDRLADDQWQQTVAAVQQFHNNHQFDQKGGEDMVYRLALMTEELGEIAEVITKGKNKEALAEECADLLILLIGNAISADFDLNTAFWNKMQRLASREGRIIDGRIRVSAFKDGSRNSSSDTK